jgi:hydrogenase maturation protease
MKTLIIGLGNPILGDDGVGWVVAERVRSEIEDPQSTRHYDNSVEVEFASLGGLSLMEMMTGAKHVILIDSIFTGTCPVGTVRQITLEELSDFSSGHSASVHDTSLRNALSVGRSMDIDLPEDKDVQIVSIEAEAVYNFSETLSKAVSETVPVAVKTVFKLLDKKTISPIVE